MRHATVIALLLIAAACSEKRQVMTVTGFVDAATLGLILPHEHVLVDFIGADSVGPHRYNRDSAFQAILPYLTDFKSSGGNSLFECTPAYLGRDPVLLLQLAKASGLNIITNTGYYGAAGEKYYPNHAFTETADQIANRWIKESNEGIDGTAIRPGFMKLSADKAPLTETQEKMVHAAAIAHLATGLAIAIHNGNGAVAREELSILETHGVAAKAFIWVHAQNEIDSTIHKSMAERGVWIEFDGLNDDNVLQYVTCLKRARAQSYLHKVLISHDAGWYHVGEPGGGSYRGYSVLQKKLIPALKTENFSQDEIEMITHGNPAAAFAIAIRKN